MKLLHYVNQSLSFLSNLKTDFSPTIFVDLVELQDQDAETIYTSLLQSLHSVAFHVQYLKSNLVGFFSDGAIVMLGRNLRMSVKMKNDFPEIIGIVRVITFSSFWMILSMM